MKISVIIPWCNRSEIARTLNQNFRNNAFKNAEVLVINGGGDSRTLHSLRSMEGNHRIRMITLDGASEFNKSECLNIGAYLSSGECLFTLDADIELSACFLEDALQLIAADKCFVTVDEVIERRGENNGPGSLKQSFIVSKTITTDYLAENGRKASVRHRVGRDNSRTGPGLVIVKKEDFFAVNGLNSTLRGWGYEDYDFQIRLQLGLGLRRVDAGRVLHYPHPPAPSLRDSNIRNAAACRSRYERGDFTGTLATDIARWRGRTIATTYSSSQDNEAFGPEVRF